MIPLCRQFFRVLRALAVPALMLLSPVSCVGGQETHRPGTGWLVPGGSRPLRVPVRVLLAGDSLMQGLGPQMRDALSGYSNLTFIPIGKKSTGLSRTDFYDWPTTLQRYLEAERPHVVVMWVGTNDAQRIYGRPEAGEPCSREWQIAYLEKVREIFSLANRYRARLILMGPPVVGDPSLDAQLVVIHRLMDWACRRHGVCYVDTRSILGNERGAFTMQGLLPNGQMAVLRTPDRLHITADGNKRVMSYLLPYVGAEIQRAFGKGGAAAPAAPRRGGTTISGKSAAGRPLNSIR